MILCLMRLRNFYIIKINNICCNANTSLLVTINITVIFTLAILLETTESPPHIILTIETIKFSFSNTNLYIMTLKIYRKRFFFQNKLQLHILELHIAKNCFLLFFEIAYDINNLNMLEVNLFRYKILKEL